MTVNFLLGPISLSRIVSDLIVLKMGEIHFKKLAYEKKHGIKFTINEEKWNDCIH